MITHKQIRIGLVASGLIVLIAIALMVKPGDTQTKQDRVGRLAAPCCMEQEAGLSVRWYLQCDPAVYYTDWQLLM